MTPREIIEWTLIERVNQVTRTAQVSPITFNDYVLFAESGSGYKNSLTYISQAVNGWTFAGRSNNRLGLKYSDNGSLFAIGYFQREDTEHFHLIPCNASSKKIKEAANILYKISGSSVYIKKVTPAQKDELLQFPDFAEVNATNGWYSTAPQEDDTFPEQIIDLEQIMQTLEKEGRPSFKDKYLRAQKRYADRLKIEHYDTTNEKHIGDVLGIILKFFELPSQVNNEFSMPEDYFNFIRLKPAKDSYFSSIFYIDGKPSAFYFAEKNGDAINVYINLALYQDNPYLSEFILIHLFHEAFKAGIRFANLGGSETAELDRFKQKFKPATQNQMHWLLYK